MRSSSRELFSQRSALLDSNLSSFWFRGTAFTVNAGGWDSYKAMGWPPPAHGDQGPHPHATETSAENIYDQKSRGLTPFDHNLSRHHHARNQAAGFKSIRGEQGLQFLRLGSNVEYTSSHPLSRFTRRWITILYDDLAQRIHGDLSEHALAKPDQAAVMSENFQS